jgi:hypothetical protein
MKKLIASIATTAALTAALTLGAAAPAGADHNVGPCNDSGEPGNSDYAQHHIVPATLGNNAHKPGSHRGFSLCIPQAG